jgi:hypothetical protein
MYKLLLICCLLLTVSFKPGIKGPKKDKPNTLKQLIKKSVNSAKVDSVIKVDSSKVGVRSFNAAAIDKYRNDPEFNYKDEKANAGLSWWQRFWTWFWELIARIFGTGSASVAPNPVFKFIIWALALGAVVFIIIKIADLSVKNIFSKESAEIDLPYSESLENIHQITFDEQIEKALAQRNYRLAVRLLYLSTLKQLNDAQLIHWQVEKTNSAYVNEIKNNDQRQSFSTLTRQFEYVWYGDFQVDSRSFQQISTLFHDFKMKLK